MNKLEQKRKKAMQEEYDKRTIEDWIVILYSIYQRHNRTCGPYDLWLQVVNDASQLGETIRREIIRTKFPSEVNVYTQLARLFCRISSFIGRYIYDFPSVENHDSIGKILCKKPLDDYIGGEERYEKWLLLKYPYTCPTCGNCPCICSAYRNIMEERDNVKYHEFWKENSKQFMKQKEKYGSTGKGLSQEVITMYNSSIDDWVKMFSDIYASGHIEVSLESVGFHFLEETGEVSDGILCLDELFKYKNKQGTYNEDRINLHEKIKDKASEDPRYHKFQKEYETKYIKKNTQKLSGEAFEYLIYINMTLIKEELADVFSWMYAILNKIKAASKHWHPEGKAMSLSDALHERYRLTDGSIGCSYCYRAICASDCLIKSSVRKSIIKRNQKLEHRFFS